MRERILKFIDASGLTAARFAEDIGVQRSSVSHILSGRNNPSFDFIQKILIKYKHINAEWLLLGSGDMFKLARQTSLFDNINSPLSNLHENVVSNEILNSEPVINSQKPTENTQNKSIIPELIPENLSNKSIEKIIVFYNDKTFSVYTPEN
jgi:transcriptional regulator with XRE-family HTH domain